MIDVSLIWNIVPNDSSNFKHYSKNINQVAEGQSIKNLPHRQSKMSYDNCVKEAIVKFEEQFIKTGKIKITELTKLFEEYQNVRRQAEKENCLPIRLLLIVSVLLIILFSHLS
jgi:hypothetical protein